MRTKIDLNKGWQFTGPTGAVEQVDVPHTWNGEDGQDGPGPDGQADYWRGTCTYERDDIGTPAFDVESERVYIEFDGVNATADVSVNGVDVIHHDGGYSTFRKDITNELAVGEGSANTVIVKADNSVNDHVYPQKADFTFYGGIYRPVRFVIVNSAHFSMDYYGGPGFQVTPKPMGDVASVAVKAWVDGCTSAKVTAIITDADGAEVATFDCLQDVDAETEGDTMEFAGTVSIDKPHLWDGRDDPYLYNLKLELRASDGDAVLDEVGCRFGIRSFSIDPDKGFFLNGRSYPLHGVSRHQDRPGIGNAITPEMHKEDMELIKELGANTIRLAHYQHSQIFYDLADEAGMVVWAEIPFISEYLPNGVDNTVSQMKELIIQNYNHPCIFVWGLSNEITISTKDKQGMLANHHMLNDMVHEMDPTRKTTVACYAVCSWFNKSSHISDLVSWNLYLGWYSPGLFVNDLWFWVWRLFYKKRPIGMSEYGCEGMPNFHSSTPHQGDQTEEYQCIYHEYMVRFFKKRPYFWATHIWNMFDFAADARPYNNGGEAGMNHKGLVTFDRKTKKDVFYLYQAWWSKDPMLHICSKRYVDRPEKRTMIKVYSNQPEVELIVNGKHLATQKPREGEEVFEFYTDLQEGENTIEARAGDLRDSFVINRVEEPNPSYTLVKEKKGTKSNWT